MKKVKLKGKLDLNKETVSKLNSKEMSDLKGGGDTKNKYSFGYYCTKQLHCESSLETVGMKCK